MKGSLFMLLKDEEGANLAEYALLLAVIVIVIIVMLVPLGPLISDFFVPLVTTLNST